MQHLNSQPSPETRAEISGSSLKLPPWPVSWSTIPRRQEVISFRSEWSVSKLCLSWNWYSKTSLKWPLKLNTKIGFQYRLWLNAGQKYCRMLQWEHSAILSTFIKLPFSIKIFVLSIFKWLLKTGFTVYWKIWIYPSFDLKPSNNIQCRSLNFNFVSAYQTLKNICICTVSYLCTSGTKWK